MIGTDIPSGQVARSRDIPVLHELELSVDIRS